MFDEEMSQKRKIEGEVTLVVRGLWKAPPPPPPVEEEEQDGRDEDALLPRSPGIDYNDLLDDGDTPATAEEEPDPVDLAMWVQVGAERRYSHRLRTKAEIKQIYQGTAGFRSLSVNEERADKYGWQFHPDQETQVAWKKLKPDPVFPTW